MPDTWKDISKRKKAEQADRIPKVWLLPKAFEPSANINNVLDVPRKCGILSPGELEITEAHDATSLIEQLSTGKLKSVDVVTAFCKRAAIAHQLTNCLTEIIFKDAIKRAKTLDSHFQQHGKPVGPLHGLPISLKDTFKIPGYDSSIGIAQFAFKPATTPSALVQLLLNAGAVLYCKTNIPQTLMALDSHNNVFGRVLNPVNRKVTAGGSSGGEGALVAMRGSVLGVGTDVGGSIRIPAMCNNLYGIKPSWQRVPYSGQQGSTLSGSSAVSIPASAGPIATSMRDCELFLRVVANEEPWNIDSDVAYGLWSDQGCTTAKKDIVIGIVRTDGLITPLPPVVKVIDETATALRAQGIQTIDMDISSLFAQCQSLANALFSMDGYQYIFDTLEATGEPLSPWLSTRLRRKNPKTLDGVRAVHAKRDELRTKFLSIWKDKNGRTIDAFVCPVAPHPVPLIDQYNGVSYTSSFVLLDYPAGTLPVRAVTATDIQGEIPTSPTLNSWDKTNRALWTEVDRSVYVGTPLCVQVVAPRLQERRLVNAMSVIDDALKAEFGHLATRAKL
ncbi:amidase [Tothia fuscella]|uniref:amidase n=1 Tax=Tothia fuscella TaxID=1048955 RepID=A0A9P4NSR2_9PEZI|nr:amidase [Tothia fuscella]